ncbi:unnamed protein product [Blepharisma stoltei]|uniref:Acid ceramidase n=1 Tax=Blepharisma stoltei TaxID=1481888 RepID=A0AAU9J0H9_9CILI|nr:unnamed protein product [Blepharisma stoltei]
MIRPKFKYIVWIVTIFFTCPMHNLLTKLSSNKNMSLLLLLGFFISSTLAYRVVPHYTVSLNDPPSTRWAHVQAPYASVIKPFAESYTKQYISPLKLKLLVELLEVGWISPELKEELQGLAQTCNITYHEAVFINYMYEYHAYCTSIVARLQNGTIIHGRNLDYHFIDFFDNTTAIVDFVKDGQLIFSETAFIWYFGVTTGISSKGYSITLNERNSGSAFDNYVSLMRGFKGDLWTIRQALIDSNTYQEAYQYLHDAKVAAPVYFILGGSGPNDGSVIVRDRTHTNYTEALNSTTWFLVQTNYDPWLPDPTDDPRRTVATQLMEEIGQADMNIDRLFDVLSTAPVLNDATVFTTVFVPETGYQNATIRG